MRRTLILLVIMISVSITQAQTDEGWEIIERCVGEPMTPPDDWSFNGTVFMYTNRAVHGLNTNIPTPYIITYSNRNRTFAFSGALSPNGAWFAVPEGSGRPAGLTVWRYDITHIKVYSTDARQITYTVDLERLVRNGSDLYISDIDQAQWLNDEEFIYPVGIMPNIYDEILLLNPFTGQESSYDGEYEPQMIYSTNWLPRADERSRIAEQTLGNIGSIVENPHNSEFAVSTSSTFYTSQKDNQTFIDHCIPITGIAFSPSGEIVISNGEEILLIQGESVYHLAYHDGRVFDGRFPEN